jgi:hypothetical protein
VAGLPAHQIALPSDELQLQQVSSSLIQLDVALREPFSLPIPHPLAVGIIKGRVSYESSKKLLI